MAFMQPIAWAVIALISVLIITYVVFIYMNTKGGKQEFKKTSGFRQKPRVLLNDGEKTIDEHKVIDSDGKLEEWILKDPDTFKYDRTIIINKECFKVIGQLDSQIWIRKDLLPVSGEKLDFEYTDEKTKEIKKEITKFLVLTGKDIQDLVEDNIRLVEENDHLKVTLSSTKNNVKEDFKDMMEVVSPLVKQNQPNFYDKAKYGG
jgi:regulator of replication initiation timing